MSIPVFPSAVQTEYPRRDREHFNVVITDSEGGVEQRVRHGGRSQREFDLELFNAPGSTEADIAKNFLNARKGEAEAFLIALKTVRNYESIYIGMGDGSRRVWRLPFTLASFYTAYVNGVEKYHGPDYEILYAAGPGGSDLLVFRDGVANGSVVEVDAAEAILCPYVRIAESYEDQLVAYQTYSSLFRLIEDRLDVDPFGA